MGEPITVNSEVLVTRLSMRIGELSTTIEMLKIDLENKNGQITALEGRVQQLTPDFEDPQG